MAAFLCLTLHSLLLIADSTVHLDSVHPLEFAIAVLDAVTPPIHPHCIMASHRACAQATSPACSSCFAVATQDDLISCLMYLLLTLLAFDAKRHIRFAFCLTLVRNGAPPSHIVEFSSVHLPYSLSSQQPPRHPPVSTCSASQEHTEQISQLHKHYQDKEHHLLAQLNLHKTRVVDASRPVESSMKVQKDRCVSKIEFVNQRCVSACHGLWLWGACEGEMLKRNAQALSHLPQGLWRVKIRMGGERRACATELSHRTKGNYDLGLRLEGRGGVRGMRSRRHANQLQASRGGAPIRRGGDSPPNKEWSTRDGDRGCGMGRKAFL